MSSWAIVGAARGIGVSDKSLVLMLHWYVHPADWWKQFEFVKQLVRGKGLLAVLLEYRPASL